MYMYAVCQKILAVFIWFLPKWNISVPIMEFQHYVSGSIAITAPVVLVLNVAIGISRLVLSWSLSMISPS